MSFLVFSNSFILVVNSRISLLSSFILLFKSELDFSNVVIFSVFIFSSFSSEEIFVSCLSFNVFNSEIIWLFCCFNVLYSCSNWEYFISELDIFWRSSVFSDSNCVFKLMISKFLFSYSSIFLIKFSFSSFILLLSNCYFLILFINSLIIISKFSISVFSLFIPIFTTSETFLFFS